MPTPADLQAAYEALRAWGEARAREAPTWGAEYCEARDVTDAARDAAAALADRLAREGADEAKACPKCEGVDLAAEHGEHLRCSRCGRTGKRVAGGFATPHEPMRVETRPCERCGGMGRVRTTVVNGVRQSVPCPACGGGGG